MRKDNLLLRIKMATQFVMQKGHVRIMTCGNCGGINIAPVEKTATDLEISKELAEKGMKRHWREIDTCCDCGASVVEQQYWVY